MTPSDSEKLEPCPYCGARLVMSDLHSTRRSAAFVHMPVEDTPCFNDGVVVTIRNHERVAAWNTRAPDSDRQQGGVTDEQILSAATAIRESSVAWADDPTEFAHLIELTPAEVRKLLAALTTQPVPVDASDEKGEGKAGLRAIINGMEFQLVRGGRITLYQSGAQIALEVLKRALQPVPAPDSGSLSPASNVTGWQPIETAPRDGTEIIIYRDGWQEAPRAKWGLHEGENDEGDQIAFGGWFLASEWQTYGVEDGFLGWTDDADVMPTHWMPLPPANSSEPG